METHLLSRRNDSQAPGQFQIFTIDAPHGYTGAFQLPKN